MNKRRSAILAAVTVVLASVLTVLLGSGSAEAHGAMMKPGSRTFFCYQDGLTPQGNIVPQNSACAAAVAQSGTNSLYNWFGVLRSDGAGRTRGFIPDGQACSGGNPGYTGFDIPGDWPITHLTAGANFDFSYNAWAAHPGWFYTYVTKDGWNPNAALTWNALEDQPFLTIDHPPVTGPVGSIDGQYKWSGALPTNKSGRHIIYSVWKRSDSAETFYGCSDVTFDGGNGEVTGMHPQTNPPTSTATSTPTSTHTSPPPGGNPCMAEYAVTSAWQGGYQAKVTVMNHGTSPFSGWRVNWTLPSGQTISNLWDGTLSLSGSAVTVRNAEWNRAVAPDATTSFGLLVNVPGINPAQPSLTCQSP